MFHSKSNLNLTRKKSNNSIVIPQVKSSMEEINHQTHIVPIHQNINSPKDKISQKSKSISKNKIFKKGDYLKSLFNDNFLKVNDKEIENYMKNSKSRSDLSSVSSFYPSLKNSMHQSFISISNKYQNSKIYKDKF